jgi:hypothetical protein
MYNNNIYYKIMSYEADARQELINRLRNVYARGGAVGRCPKGERKFAPAEAYVCKDPDSIKALRATEKAAKKVATQARKKIAQALRQQTARETPAKPGLTKKGKPRKRKKKEIEVVALPFIPDSYIDALNRLRASDPDLSFRNAQAQASAMWRYFKSTQAQGSGYNPNYGGPGMYGNGGVMMDSMYGEGRSGGVLMDQFYNY